MFHKIRNRELEKGSPKRISLGCDLSDVDIELTRRQMLEIISLECESLY